MRIDETLAGAIRITGMSTLAVQVHRVDPSLDLESDLRTARWLATLLDAQFSIGGFKFGIDPIIDLVPVVGDALMVVVGLYPVYLARKHNLGRAVQTRMMLNLAIEFVGGAIPLVGSLFDAAYRANLKNVALLEKAARRAR